MKFDRQLRPATETSWVVSYSGKTIPRWRTAAILKTDISPYLSEKSSDFIKFCTQQHILNWMNVTWSKIKRLHLTDSEFISCSFVFLLGSLINDLCVCVCAVPYRIAYITYCTAIVLCVSREPYSRWIFVEIMSNASKLPEKQQAQLSQRDRATLRIIEYLAKSLKVIHSFSVKEWRDLEIAVMGSFKVVKRDTVR